MNEIIENLGEFVFDLLPDSPFQSFLATMEQVEFLGVLNWFIPISSFISIGTGWLTCVALYYAYQVILRWINAIE